MRFAYRCENAGKRDPALPVLGRLVHVAPICREIEADLLVVELTDPGWCRERLSLLTGRGFTQ